MIFGTATICNIEVVSQCHQFIFNYSIVLRSEHSKHQTVAVPVRTAEILNRPENSTILISWAQFWCSVSRSSRSSRCCRQSRMNRHGLIDICTIYVLQKWHGVNSGPARRIHGEFTRRLRLIQQCVCVELPHAHCKQVMSRPLPYILYFVLCCSGNWQNTPPLSCVRFFSMGFFSFFIVHSPF